ncbi:MAG: hypothetical protein AB8G99_23420 [Planctomycetaceae bacterium]
MTLQIPRDIGGTPNLFGCVVEQLEAMANPVGHIIDGAFCSVSLSKDELPGIACGLTACRSIYICEPPEVQTVAGFILNEHLRHAKLVCLIDSEPPGKEIPTTTAASLCTYVRSLFENHPQIDSVGIPGNHPIKPMFGQAIDRGPTTVISLADTERPRN